MTKKIKREKAFLIVGLFLLVFIVILSLRELGIQFRPEEAMVLIRSWGPLAPFVYVGIVVINVIIPPFTHLPFMLVILKVFGFWVTYFSLIIGNLIGGSLAFLVAKYFGRPLVEKIVGERGIKKIDDLIEIMGWQSLLVLRIFAGPLFDYISYAAGLTSLRFPVFVIVTAAAGFFGTALFLYLAHRSFVLLGLWILIAYILTSLTLGFLFWRAKRIQVKKSK